LTRIALSHGLSLFQEPEQEEMEPLARRYCSRYNDKYIEWLPEAGMSILTDDYKAILKSNQFNKIDAHYGQRRSIAKEGAKRRCLHCAKYNELNAEICIGRLGGKLYEKAMKDQNQFRRFSNKSILC
jgi:hypothetical protein